MFLVIVRFLVTHNLRSRTGLWTTEVCVYKPAVFPSLQATVVTTCTNLPDTLALTQVLILVMKQIPDSSSDRASDLCKKQIKYTRSSKMHNEPCLTGRSLCIVHFEREPSKAASRMLHQSAILLFLKSSWNSLRLMRPATP